MISEAEIFQANEAGSQIRASGLYAIAACYDADAKVIHVTLASGFTISFPKERSQVTVQASDEQLQDIKIGAAGWTVDFPKLDDGLTIEGMLAGRFGNHRWEESWAREHQPAQAA